LTEVVKFKTLLQRGNRIQVPRLIRWQFKLEPDQVLKVMVLPIGYFLGPEEFYGHMNKDGRITLPYLTREIFRSKKRELQTLEGIVLEVSLKPA
jgi:hypothetical protein